MVKRIFSVMPDVQYWMLLPVSLDFWQRCKLFQLRNLSIELKEESFYVDDPVRTKRGDFFGLSSGGLVFSSNVFRSGLGRILERAGEILPGKLEATGEAIYIFNCTASYNCLDRASTQMRTTPDGKVAVEIKKYGFHADRVGESTLFKIPETHRVRLYSLTGRGDEGDEFETQYRQMKFTGLQFQEVWNDEFQEPQ